MMPETVVLWEEFHGRLRAFIARRVDPPADVDDLVQEVFLRVVRHGDDLARQERVEAWLYQITRNVIADHYRAPAWRRERSGGAPADLDGTGVAPAVAEDATAGRTAERELAACLAPLLDRLPAVDRQALALTAGEGLTQPAAAARLGLSVSGMKSRVQRARRRLRGALLACCRVELDRRGGVIAYHARRPCGCGAPGAGARE